MLKNTFGKSRLQAHALLYMQMHYDESTKTASAKFYKQDTYGSQQAAFQPLGISILHPGLVAHKRPSSLSEFIFNSQAGHTLYCIR